MNLSRLSENSDTDSGLRQARTRMKMERSKGNKPNKPEDARQ